MGKFQEIVYQKEFGMLKNSYKNNTLRAVVVILLLGMILGFFPLTAFFIDFLETYIVPDGNLASNTVFVIQSGVVLFIISLWGLLIFSFSSIRLGTIHLINKFIDTEKVGRFFFIDRITEKKGLAKLLFVVGTVTGVLIHLYLLTFGQPVQEGIIETASSFLFLLAAFILALASFDMNSEIFFRALKRKIRIVIWIIISVLLYIFGEEISWGQHFFKWESFGIFKEMNFQSETNTHNFFNPIFRYLYPTVATGTFVILFFLWFFPREQSYLVKLFVPPVSLFFLSVLMVAASIMLEHEIFEELLAVFFLLYSVRIFVCLRFPVKEALS